MSTPPPHGARPGIVDVVISDDVPFGRLPPIARFVPDTMTRTLLAEGTVRFVGEPIVAIVGETAAAVEDAIEPSRSTTSRSTRSCGPRTRSRTA